MSETSADHYDLYAEAAVAEPLIGAVRRTFIRTHGPAVCDGGRCVLHNPSDHPLVNAPAVFRADKRFLVERTCEHGVGHPDPDSVAHLTAETGETHWGVHGCDGCCHSPTDDADGA